MTLVAILALAGLIDTVYLRWKRMNHQSMVRPLKQDCASLYDLPQAKLLGVHWDIWGIAYYAGMFVLAAFLSDLSFSIALLKLGAIIGLVVSAYLLYIQYWVKNYCTWCLLSELITVLIALAIFL